MVTLNGEGWCYIFAVKPELLTENPEPASEETQGQILRPIHQQHLTANNKVVLIADIGKQCLFDPQLNKCFAANDAASIQPQAYGISFLSSALANSK